MIGTEFCYEKIKISAMKSRRKEWNKKKLCAENHSAKVISVWPCVQNDRMVRQVRFGMMDGKKRKETPRRWGVLMLKRGANKMFVPQWDGDEWYGQECS